MINNQKIQLDNSKNYLLNNYLYLNEVNPINSTITDILKVNNKYLNNDKNGNSGIKLKLSRSGVGKCTCHSKNNYEQNIFYLEPTPCFNCYHIEISNKLLFFGYKIKFSLFNVIDPAGDKSKIDYTKITSAINLTICNFINNNDRALFSENDGPYGKIREILLRDFPDKMLFINDSYSREEMDNFPYVYYLNRFLCGDYTKFSEFPIKNITVKKFLKLAKDIYENVFY